MATRDAKMRLYQLYLPAATDGRDIALDNQTWIWEELCQFAGGCTVISDVAGWWRDPAAAIVDDAITLVLVLAPDTRQSERFFRHLAEKLVDRLCQQEIYIHSLPVELIVATSQATQPSWPRAAD